MGESKMSTFIFPINIIDLIICATLGICLIYSFYTGSGSETIIGIFGGYLGATAKNAKTINNNTTTNESGSVQNTTHNNTVKKDESKKDDVKKVTEKVSNVIDESREMLKTVEKVNNTVKAANELKDVFKK